MSTQSPPDLNALLGSRICHDLINPVGAIGNGLELMELSGNVQDGPEFALISESVRATNARIRLFRIAFGQASPGQTVSRSEFTGILADSYASGRVTISASPPETIQRSEAKLALLLVLAIESALPLGGTVTLTGDGAAWQIKASAKRLNCDPRLWAPLSAADLPPDLSPGEIQFALLPDAAQQAGRQMRVALSDTEIDIVF